MSDFEIPLAEDENWEDSIENQEAKQNKEEENSSNSDLSERAIIYLAQIQDLQQQLEQEHLKVQRLEMAIKGFSIALQEEIEKGH
jgi:molecular chaperone GrpE (heat shock protein)